MSEHERHDGGDGKSVGERNVERLVGKVYRPEVPDAGFAAGVTERMLAEAKGAAGAAGACNSMERHMRTNNWRIWIPSAIAAMVMIGLGIVAVVVAMREDEGVRREGAVVWIDGEAYVPAPSGSDADANKESWTRATELDNLADSRSWFSGLTPKPMVNPPATQPVNVGETIVTGDGEKRRVVLADGSVLYLNQNTSVKVEGDRRVSVGAGEVYVEVSPREAGSGGGPTFVVKTPGRELSAMGTKFGVTVGDEGTGLLVTQGKVRVSGLDEPVLSGQQLAAEKADAEKPVTAAPRASHALDWTQELMAAANSPLVPDSEYEGGALIVVDPSGQESRLSLRKYHVDTHIQDGFMRTTIDQTYFNHENRRLEGTFYFPLPADASLSRLAMYVEGKLMEGGMAERDYARNVYESIVYTQKDPALLEWMDGSTFKMRVFPLEARQEKRILISYVQKLPELYAQAEYRFPAGHNLGLVRDWSFHATVKNGAMTHWSCDSHELAASQSSGDLLLDAKAKHVKPDRDIVLKLYDSSRMSLAETVRFSSAMHENAKYLMLRYRPNLPSVPVRERRDWVFLFEASGNRDPLLARAQVDVSKTILENAEHEDTFAIVTAGTRTQAYATEAKTATPGNVRDAVAFLERVHLVGALDLSKALAATEPFVKAAENPYIVHVGTGIAALGERKEDVLAKQVPERAKYVGVGVGKRWSRALMKQAASRTGGYFTQINPDEDVTWRAFDLLATLNTPRLLDVKVSDPSGKLAFLGFTDSLAQGEEIAAVARTEGNAVLPEEVVVSGTLNGERIERTVPVSDVAEGAGYLPRTWAKLEIDRLLAEDAEKNKGRIIELSKAMYVMSPFTSLLVLENEAMYEQYKVDRGRKDHWALYPAPEKIAVVYEPDANTPARATPGSEQQPAVKPPVEQVLQTIIVRMPSQVLYWPNQQRYHGNRALSAFQLMQGAYGEMEEDLVRRDSGTRNLLLSYFDTDFAAPPDLDLASFMGSGQWVEWNMRPGDDAMLGRRFVSTNGRRGPSRGLSVRGSGEMYRWAKRNEVLEEQFGLDGVRLRSYVSGSVMSASAASGPAAPLGKPGQARQPVSLFGRFGGLAGGRVAGGGGGFGGRGGLPGLAELRDIPSDFGTQSFALTQLRRSDRANAGGQFFQLAQLGEGKKDTAAFADVVASRLLGGRGHRSLIYQRPQFHGDYRIFSDLLQYAPGMNTTLADIYAVLEAEAAGEAENARGSIDPKAKALIERARAAGWRRMTSGDGEASVTITFDGAGRYFYERTVSDGLVERVYCDGRTLHHLYPMLGVGARRDVSRFHRAEFAAAVPFVVLPAEDMARGADVRMVGNNIVAIVPREVEATPTTRPTTQPVRVAMHLVFDDEARLVEGRIVEVPSNKVVYRQTLAGDGTVRVLNGEGKELDEVEVELRQAEAPQLKPDAKELVVLPMPYRTRDHVLRSRNIANKGMQEWSDDDALAVMTADVAQHAHEVQQLAGSRFIGKGDKRIGFYTLMMSAGQNWDPKQEHNYGNGITATLDPTRDHPGSKLAKFIVAQMQMNRNGHGSEVEAPTETETLIDRLAMLRHIWSEYNSGRATRDEPSRKRSAERSLAFVKATKEPAFAWAVLTLMQNYGGEAEFYKAIAEQLKSFEQIAGLSYAARYEYARNLYRSGDHAQAQKAFEQLYRDAIERGAMPAVDHDFRNAFNANNAHDQFATIVREASAAIMEKAGRMAGIYLAWQVQQIGDGTLAEELFGAAMANVPEDQRLMTTLAAVDYLWHTGQNARADAMLEPILAEKEYAEHPELWRLAAAVASGRGMLAKALAYQEKALDLEYEQLPVVVNLQAVRQDYGMLLNQYEQLANAIATLQSEPPRDFLAKVIRVTDRWRALDPDDTAASQSAARILQRLGADEMAWEYLTTPLAESANEATPWTNLASTLRQQGDFGLADRAYTTAYEIEPTNAQILWDRAQLLQQSQRHAEAMTLYRQIAEGEWQPRFNWVQQQARRYVQAN